MSFFGVFMKRTLIFMLLLTAVLMAGAGALFAQTQEPDSKSPQRREPPLSGRSGPPRESRQNAETSTITGKLELINGNIAVKNGDTVYYPIGLDRLIGFVDGLKEGAEVSLEGWSFGASRDTEYRRFLVSKLTLNGKEYSDLLPDFGPMMGAGGPLARGKAPDFGPGGDFKGPGCPGMGWDRNQRGRDNRRR
jgi:hypothetical protein